MELNSNDNQQHNHMSSAVTTPAVVATNSSSPNYSSDFNLLSHHHHHQPHLPNLVSTNCCNLPITASADYLNSPTETSSKQQLTPSSIIKHKKITQQISGGGNNFDESFLSDSATRIADKTFDTKHIV